jgi:20S proteasome alpha/beta subunit
MPLAIKPVMALFNPQFDMTPRKPYPPRPKPPKRKKPVTIAIGFKCQDGVVLCTDRQITDSVGAMKYTEQKIYPIIGDTWCVVSAYAGYRDIMQAVQTEFQRRLSFEPNPTPDFVENCLLGVLKAVKRINRKDMEYQQMLCAVSTPGGDRLLRFQSDLSTEVGDWQWEYLGIGNSSLIRFLADISGSKRTTITASQALMIGFYMVLQANKYIDGCGKGPDLAFVRRGRCATSSKSDRMIYKPPTINEIDLQDAFLAVAQGFDFRGVALERSLQNILDKSSGLREWMRKVVGPLLPEVNTTDKN